MQPLAADDPGQVGGYRLLGQLGAGGMGRVYLGRTTGGRTVAVKLVRSDLAGDSEFRARFRQEVAAARRVGGTWTAPVLDADTEGGQPWVATGYVAGPALTVAVQEFGPLPEPTVRTLGVGLAEALAHVHGLGLVHRDVKPSNVLLTLDGPRLIDFGIARALDAAAVLTRSGQVVGSPGFMSPEQANGLPAGAAGDVFSLGAVLAYAATGTMPFGSGVSAPVLLYRVLHEEPDLSGLTGGLHSIVRDCLARDPSARPTPGQLRERLDGDGAAAARLGQGHWLPPALAAAVGRSAVQLLDLEGAREAGQGAAASALAAPAAPAPATPTLAAATPVTAPGPRTPAGSWTVAEAARAARAAEVAKTAPGGAVPGAPAGPPAAGVPGFGPPVPPAVGPGGPVGPYAPTPFPAPAPVPTRSVPGTAPGYGPYPQRPGGRRGYGALAAVLAVAVLLGGGYLLVERLKENNRQDASAAAASDPGRTTPAADSPAPAVASTDPGPGIVPAQFLGTWVGEQMAANGDVTTLTLTIVQSAKSEEKSRIRAETPKTGTWCEGAWTLTDADESRVSYASRMTGTSAGEKCVADRSAYRVITMQPDGTLRYSMDLLKPDQYLVLRKKA
ncbi:serine/threonine-protein kinase [Kitasatospora sp. NPDC058170]|uniref:serine/threonine-protein kinase n=1 Tax=Kitasatospora sp. NPDC058170 TaxID=3346364 RepID=UPI0036D9DA47